MNKEQYIKMRNSGEWDLTIAYEFYLGKKPNPVIPFQVFIQIFPIYLQQNIEAIKEKMDEEFGLDICIFEQEIKVKQKQVKEIVL